MLKFCYGLSPTTITITTTITTTTTATETKSDVLPNKLFHCTSSKLVLTSV